jgi:hypothetical protein
VSAAGAEQVIVVTSDVAVVRPHALRARAVEPRARLAEYLAGAEASSARDALTALFDRFSGVYQIQPTHNAVGLFDGDGSYDERSDRTHSLSELTDRGYEDAYRQFVEPIVGAGGERIVTNRRAAVHAASLAHRGRRRRAFRSTAVDPERRPRSTDLEGRSRLSGSSRQARPAERVSRRGLASPHYAGDAALVYDRGKMSRPTILIRAKEIKWAFRWTSDVERKLGGGRSLCVLYEDLRIEDIGAGRGASCAGCCGPRLAALLFAERDAQARSAAHECAGAELLFRKEKAVFGRPEGTLGQGVFFGAARVPQGVAE